MRNRYKYVIVIIVFVIISVIIIRFPSAYFALYDKNSTKKYQTHQVSLSNVYDNYHLSNDQKIKIMMTAEGKGFSLKEEVSKRKYNETLDEISKELEKLDVNLFKLFEEELRSDYDELLYADFNRIYISSDSSNSLILRNINYENDNYFVSVTMDIYDNTILEFMVNTRLDYSLQYNNEIQIYDNFKKYLDISYDKAIFTFISESEFYFGFDYELYNMNDIKSDKEFN